MAEPTGASKTPEFEEASIRQCDPDNLPPTPEGMRGGGVNSFQMTPGRTHALCMTLATLIRTAYFYSPADIEVFAGNGRGRGMAFNNVYGLGVEDGIRVRGGPDWVRKDRYSIEAIAQGPSDAATMQGPMLRALLERCGQGRSQDQAGTGRRVRAAARLNAWSSQPHAAS
jgi:hypothetical protein